MLTGITEEEENKKGGYDKKEHLNGNPEKGNY